MNRSKIRSHWILSIGSIMVTMSTVFASENPCRRLIRRERCDKESCMHDAMMVHLNACERQKPSLIPCKPGELAGGNHIFGAMLKKKKKDVPPASPRTMRLKLLAKQAPLVQALREKSDRYSVLDGRRVKLAWEKIHETPEEAAKRKEEEASKKKDAQNSKRFSSGKSKAGEDEDKGARDRLEDAWNDLDPDTRKKMTEFMLDGAKRAIRSRCTIS